MLQEYNTAEGLALSMVLSSFSVLQPALAEITDENLLAKMLRYELDTQNRETMVRRIKTRFNKIRDIREMKEIREYAETKKSNY